MLNETQKLAAKKHLGANPIDTIIDPFFSTLEDGSAMEQELIDSIDECDLFLAAIKAAQTASDEITQACDATFNYSRNIAIKKQQYSEAVGNLARIIGWPYIGGNQITGLAIV